MEINLYGLISVTAAIILAVIIRFLVYRKLEKTEKARRADYDKKYEIAGIVAAVEIIPYIPGGFLLQTEKNKL